MRILDVGANPEDPPEVGAFTDFYIHDSYTRGNVLFASAISDGFEALLDVSDPRRVREITRFFTGGRFTHNSWVTRDGRYLFTTDERTGQPVEGWDITNPTAPRKVTQFIANPAAIAHNVMIDGDRLLVSHYTEGVYLLDVRNPEQPRVLGSYDTYPGRVGRLQRGLGRVHLPGLEPHRRERHPGRPVRDRLHGTVILRALGITRGDVVAVAGAGGKTTLVYRLAREARVLRPHRPRDHHHAHGHARRGGHRTRARGVRRRSRARAGGGAGARGARHPAGAARACRTSSRASPRRAWTPWPRWPTSCWWRRTGRAAAR